MPAIYDKPRAFQNAVVEDVNRFQKVDFYLVKNEVKVFPQYNIFEQLLSDPVNWRPNEGNTMRGVTPQSSPVAGGFFFPKEIASGVPNKDLMQVSESTEDGKVYYHDYESYQFNFLPSFNAFWNTYLKFADSDIASKIAIRNNQFIETQMWFTTPNVALAGTGLLSGTPIAQGNAAGDAANSKTTAWLINTVQGAGLTSGVKQHLTLRDINNAALILREDMGAPGFDGTRNMPKDSTFVKDKYVLVTGTEDWSNFPYDPDTDLLKSIQLNLLTDGFNGMLFGNLTTKFNPRMIRFNIVDVKDLAGNVLYAAGTPIPSQIFDATDKKCKPNPYYTNIDSAPYTISWLLGGEFGSSIKVGPPPKEFAGSEFSKQKFYPMKWNGEIQLTDQVLITYSDGTVGLNSRGEQLKFQSRATHGYLPKERRFGIPIIHRRKRPVLMS